MNCYRFSAIRGVQGGRAYFVIMVPFDIVERLFAEPEPELPPDLAAQRELAARRVPGMARYIVDNAESYVLPALSASIDGRHAFAAAGVSGADRAVGTLEIDLSARLVINDGQHRRAAIIAALRERPHLSGETIAVTLFPHLGLEHAQQMFVDLNQHAVKPARSLRLFYDGRDPEARLTRDVLDGVPVLRLLTDVTRSTPGAGSRRLFGLGSVHVGIRTFSQEYGGDPDSSCAVAAEFWRAVVDAMPDWLAAARLAINPAELRRDMVHSHGLVLEALAISGARLLRSYPRDWKERLGRLGAIDWSRAHPQWEGRALFGGRVNRSRTSIMLTAELIWGYLDADTVAPVTDAGYNPPSR